MEKAKIVLERLPAPAIARELHPPAPLLKRYNLLKLSDNHSLGTLVFLSGSLPPQVGAAEKAVECVHQSHRHSKGKEKQNISSTQVLLCPLPSLYGKPPCGLIVTSFNGFLCLGEQNVGTCEP